MRRTALPGSVSSGSQKCCNQLSTVPRQDRRPIPRDPQGMLKSPGLALLEKGFRTQTSCLWFLASCEQSMSLLGLAVCRDSGGLPPGPLPSLKNRNPVPSKTGQKKMPLAHAFSSFPVSSLGPVPSSGIRWPHPLPGPS